MTAAANLNRAAALVAELQRQFDEKGAQLFGLHPWVKLVVVEGGIEVCYRGKWLVTLNPDAFQCATALHEHLFHLIRACAFFHLAERAA